MRLRRGFALFAGITVLLGVGGAAQANRQQALTARRDQIRREMIERTDPRFRAQVTVALRTKTSSRALMKIAALPHYRIEDMSGQIGAGEQVASVRAIDHHKGGRGSAVTRQLNGLGMATTTSNKYSPEKGLRRDVSIRYQDPGKERVVIAESDIRERFPRSVSGLVTKEMLRGALRPGAGGLPAQYDRVIQTQVGNAPSQTRVTRAQYGTLPIQILPVPAGTTK